MRVVFIIIGLLIPPVMLAVTTASIKPVSIRIANDNQAKIALSNQDINRIFVENDKIVSMNKPSNRVVAHNDQSGSVFMNIHGNEPFTAFIATQKGRHFSLLVIPKSEPGQTIQFIPKTAIPIHYHHHSHQAKRFEQSSPYEKTLINLLREVMLQHTPPGYTAIKPKAFHQITAFKLPNYRKDKRILNVHVIKGFLGGDLAVRILELTNDGDQRATLRASDFYTPGVRAVAMAKEMLVPHESTHIYEVISNA